MPGRILCDKLIRCLNAFYGPDRAIGAVHRWKIDRPGAAPVVIGVDYCTTLPVKVWVFDPERPQLTALSEFLIEYPEEVGIVVNRLAARIDALKERQDQSDQRRDQQW